MDWVIIRLAADFSVMGWLTCAADSMTTFNVVDAGSSTFTPPVWVCMNTCTPLACAAAHTGSKSREWYGFGGVAGRRMAREPAAGTRPTPTTPSLMLVSGMGAVGASREKYGV